MTVNEDSGTVNQHEIDALKLWLQEKYPGALPIVKGMEQEILRLQGLVELWVPTNKVTSASSTTMGNDPDVFRKRLESLKEQSDNG